MICVNVKRLCFPSTPPFLNIRLSGRGAIVVAQDLLWVEPYFIRFEYLQIAHD